MSRSLLTISWISLIVSGCCAVAILIDILAGRRQKMGVMNFVWPITGLYAGPLGLLAYFAIGRAPRQMHMAAMSHVADSRHSMKSADRPMWQTAITGTTHCGAGCTLGDVLADGGLFLLGLSTLFGSALLTSYIVDFIAAYLLGIVFQYFAIAPMRHLPPGKGIIAAIKADTLSLIAFQIGMYAWMAVYQLLIFHPRLEPNSPVYWFMMQIGMIAGFITSYPMNWWLIKSGIKESM